MTLDLPEIGGFDENSDRGVPFALGRGEEDRTDLGDEAFGGNVYGRSAGV